MHFILQAKSVPNLLEQEAALLASHPGWVPFFRRYFLSEASQRNLFPEREGAVSYIIQPPLDGSTVASWLMLVPRDEVEEKGGMSRWKKGEWELIAHASLAMGKADSFLETDRILQQYEASLNADGMTMEGNCVRTWFFCKDIDHHYSGLVKARREFFSGCGMLPHTHYIASTGIGGVPLAENSIVSMDAWAMKGRFSQQYLYGRSHLSATSDYGVTFERGVKIGTADVETVLISGTASIDNTGKILHEGDVEAQTLRMLENVEVLLKEGGCGWKEVKVILVYFRCPEHAGKVEEMLGNRFGDIPYIILHAPVCRPGWLVEMECLACLKA